ncbi:MAG: hypothetical protein KBC38_00020 [Candidatus Pacebacteria bacterium]|nr:hypothetical protein [Candidatus Paceibacterota bacterium]MBP9840388.1 hypothetical protein [Candidatus Paceibacterota bacterium]
MNEAKAKRQCEACGGQAVPHGLLYANIVIDSLVDPFIPSRSGKGGWLARTMHRIEEWAAPRIFRATVALGIAKRVNAPDDDTLLLAKVLWEDANTRGVDMWEWRLFGLARNLFHATLPDGRRIAFEGLPLPERDMYREPWMDDKAELKKRFGPAGFPIAAGGSFKSLERALEFFRERGGTFITKPHSGSASRHTTLHIDTEEKLIRAFRIAKQVSPVVVVEEELQGPVYRATVVAGNFVALLRRDPPHVIGDGVHTVRELMEEANKHPGRGGPYFSKMKIDRAAEEELAWQGLTPESVPEADRRVTLHQKVNWSLGGTTTDVTDDVHPDNIRLFEDSARFLKASISGIDFIMTDPAKSWKEQKLCGFLECNSMPFFDNHHLPFEGMPRNVAEKIWEMNGVR